MGILPATSCSDGLDTVADELFRVAAAAAELGFAPGASHFLRRSGQTNRLPPHPGPLPLGGGEGESLAISPRRLRRKSSNGLGRAMSQPTAPPDSLSPSEGERVGVRGLPRDQRTAATSAALLPLSLGGKGLG